MRRYDSDDSEDKLEVGKFLEQHDYGPIGYDYFLCFDKLSGELQMMAGSLTQEQVERYKVQHPDIVVFGHPVKPMFIVEIDGSIHHTKPGMRQTERRNSTYHRAGVKCIILDKKALKILKMTWQDYLIQELEIKEP